MLEIEENEKILKEILEKLNEIKKSIKLDNLRSNLNLQHQKIIVKIK